MQVDKVIGAIVDHSTLTGEQASLALGYSRSYVSMAKQGRTPSLATAASVADVCGCDVVIVDRATGERVGVVDPPRRGQASGAA